MSARSPGGGCAGVFNSRLPAQEVKAMPTLQTVINEIKLNLSRAECTYCNHRDRCLRQRLFH